MERAKLTAKYLAVDLGRRQNTIPFVALKASLTLSRR